MVKRSLLVALLAAGCAREPEVVVVEEPTPTQLAASCFARAVAYCEHVEFGVKWLHLEGNAVHVKCYGDKRSVVLPCQD